MSFRKYSYTWRHDSVICESIIVVNNVQQFYSALNKTLFYQIFKEVFSN